jgi:hypothetical protein
MKTWEELSDQEQDGAHARAKSVLVDSVIEGLVELKIFNILADKKLKSILSGMRKNETMIEAKELIVKNSHINRELDRLSLAIAEGSKYGIGNVFLT